MLFNEPKLLKSTKSYSRRRRGESFSALQRAEIAEIFTTVLADAADAPGFSALQRAEIAEMARAGRRWGGDAGVSVLFNEPKLLKFSAIKSSASLKACFSALQRAEIAEIKHLLLPITTYTKFQCSSTSRNC